MFAAVCLQLMLSPKPLTSAALLLSLSNALGLPTDNSFPHFLLNFQSFNFSTFICYKRKIPIMENFSLSPGYTSESSDASIEFQVSLL